MLWNSVFEFFVKYVFGGRLNSGSFDGIIGLAYGNGNWNSLYSSTLSVGEYTNVYGDIFSMSLGNYLSLIATFISITIIVVLCCLFIKKIISLVGGLIR